jgi:signal transduction histidine kinase
MRLKTKLVLAITALVFFISGIISLVYVSQLLHSDAQQSYITNRMVANQVAFAVRKALESGLADRTIDPNDPNELRTLATEAVRSDSTLQAVIESVNRYSAAVYDINIADSHAVTILSTNPDNEEKPLPPRRQYSELLHASPIQLTREVLGPPAVFDISVPIERNSQPFITVNVGISTTLLKFQYTPYIIRARYLMCIVLAAALVASFLLATLALRPLQLISKQLDALNAAGDLLQEEERKRSPDMAVSVSRKIERFGQRMRNVEEVFSALKENLDQILGNLQDGIVLFTADQRAVLVSQAARRFLSLDDSTILGLHASEIFDPHTLLGRALGQAFATTTSLPQEVIVTETGRRIELSLEFIQDGKSAHGLGALLTLHDLESVEAVESELEISRRMAAIGRLTSGVGHEVKNPINAIVVHVELLKSKLAATGAGAPASRHLEIIESEIHRLDRVVQMLVDFSRPVELQLRERDLRAVVGEVLALAVEELSTQNVTLIRILPPSPLPVNIDADLIKQAVINVIKNGAQAMPEGGTLRVTLEDSKRDETRKDESRKFAVLRIADEGPGIPEDVREKIFDLYFTTKTGGSGIGLAMTYRILQLHYGSVEVQSNRERGTEFVLRIPLSSTDWGRRQLEPISTLEQQTTSADPEARTHADGQDQAGARAKTPSDTQVEVQREGRIDSKIDARIEESPAE